jgi:hypothetical protein
MFFNYFNMIIDNIKNKFFKNKKYYFNIYIYIYNQKYFKKQKPLSSKQPIISVLNLPVLTWQYQKHFVDLKIKYTSKREPLFF